MAKGYNGSKTKHSIRDLFQTPQYLYDWYNTRYTFTHDVAASDLNHKAPLWFTEAQDSLVQPWGTSNWCNPPYSNIMPWVEKAIAETARGNTTVMLIPADTSVAWFKKAFDNCYSCEFINGRISFINVDTGKPQSGNNKGSVVFIFSPNNTLRNPCREKTILLNRKDMEN